VLTRRFLEAVDLHLPAVLLPGEDPPDLDSATRQRDKSLDCKHTQAAHDLLIQQDTPAIAG
jgi:hypothetical protein